MIQIVNSEEFDLAKKILSMKSDGASWGQVEDKYNLSGRQARRLLKKYNMKFTFFRDGRGREYKERNKLILDYVFECETPRSQHEAVAHFKSIGRPEINRSVINGVLARARYSGLIVSSKDVQLRQGRKDKPLEPPSIKVEGLPPRTPELLARGKVTWGELSRRGCRYTPSEEAPFLYCGEPQEYDKRRSRYRSWCSHCYENIIRKKEDELLCAANDNALEEGRREIARSKS